MFGLLRTELGVVFHELVRQKDSLIKEGHLMPGHVHMLVQIPPESSVSGVVGCIKGKSAIRVARDWYGKQRNFGGEHFRARGFYVSTIGRNEEVIRTYIRDQEKRDQEEDRQLGLPFN